LLDDEVGQRRGLWLGLGFGFGDNRELGRVLGISLASGFGHGGRRRFDEGDHRLRFRLRFRLQLRFWLGLHCDLRCDLGNGLRFRLGLYVRFGLHDRRGLGYRLSGSDDGLWLDSGCRLWRGHGLERRRLNGRDGGSGLSDGFGRLLDDGLGVGDTNDRLGFGIGCSERCGLGNRFRNRLGDDDWGSGRDRRLGYDD
jgi:hypothetical protein